MKKYIFSFMCILLLVTFIYIVGFSNTDNKDNKKLVVAEVTHSIFYAPQYLAIEKGFFEEYGLDVEIILTPGADKVTSSILSKDADIGLAGLETVAFVNNGSNTKLKAFSGLTKRDGTFIITKENYKDFTFNDLRNTNIIAGRHGGMPSFILNYVLSEKGIDSKKDLLFDTSIAITAQESAFMSGNYDAIFLFEPSSSKMVNASYGYNMGSIASYTKDLPYTVYFTLDNNIKSNEEDFKNFDKAINKALKYIDETNEKTLAKDLKTYFPSSSESEIENAVKNYKEAKVYRASTLIKEEEVKYLDKILKFNEAIDYDLKYSNLIDNRFWN